MNAKERIQLGYDLFNKHDMETFFKELVDENTTWTVSYTHLTLPTKA